jgi:ribosomal protein L21E
MPIKVYRNKFEHVHENIFFRQLALELTKLYNNRKENAVLIGNPVILDEDGNKIAPDALFLTGSSFNIIDFKNFEGEITLPTSNNFEIESWKGGDIVVKGGNQVNPYVQLKNHKLKLGDYLNYHKSSFLSKPSKFHTKFIDCIVCFINSVQLKGDIPELERNWFFIKDKNSITSALEDITTTRISLSDGDLERLAHLFSTTLWNPEEAASISAESEEKYKEQQYHLTDEQSRIFTEIQNFLINKEENALILSGSYSSGKTFLINYLIKNIPKDTVNGWQVLAPNNRIARNVRKQIESVDSLYSHIFKFSEQVEVPIENEDEADTEENSSQEEPELVDTKLIFNIRENNESENFLYIIDEAHHISDASFISPTIQFGTGQLLSDLLTYIDTEKTKRKILFIGDKYRLAIGSYEESALCADYLQSEYSLKCREIEIQPYPPTNTNILKQAFSVRNQIIKDQYNQLNLVDSDVVKVAKSDGNLAQAMRKHFSEELYNTKILTFSNDNILESNNWVRSKVLNRNAELEKGDIVIINNNVIVAPDNPFAVPQKIFKGEFAEVISVSNDTINISQPFKGKKPVQLYFRELKLKLVERNLEVNVLSFENYWNSTANEINREEYIAIHAYINQKVSNQINEEKNTSEEWQEFIASEQYKTLKSEIDKLQEQFNHGEQVKIKLETSKKNLRKVENNFWRNRRIEIHRDIVYHDKYVNAVNLRYGYALTVHRAQSYKWNHIFFNLNQGDDRGTDNKGYFKWVYSGIGCAKKRLYLVNTPQITPYIKMVWKDNHACVVNNDAKKEFFPFTDDTPIELRDKPFTFESVSDFLFNFYCWLSSELDTQNISVKKVDHKEYAEHYQLIGKNSEEAKVIIWYDKLNRFKKHKIATSSPNEFGTQIDDFLNNLKSGEIIVTNSGTTEFSDSIISELFNVINDTLTESGVSVFSVTHQNYADRVILKKQGAIFIFDIFLNSEGFISTIYPIKCNNPELYDVVKTIFNEFIVNHGKPLAASE